MQKLLKQNVIMAVVFIVLLGAAMGAVVGYGESVYNPFTIAAGDPEAAEEPPAEPEEEPEEEPAAEAQVLQGSAEGYGGELTVEVELADGEIVAVRVVDHSETAGLSDPAIEQVPAAVVEAQSTEVDSVSGATVTSEAIKAAVQAALDDAGL